MTGARRTTCSGNVASATSDGDPTLRIVVANHNVMMQACEGIPYQGIWLPLPKQTACSPFQLGYSPGSSSAADVAMLATPAGRACQL